MIKIQQHPTSSQCWFSPSLPSSSSRIPHTTVSSHYSQSNRVQFLLHAKFHFRALKVFFRLSPLCRIKQPYPSLMHHPQRHPSKNCKLFPPQTLCKLQTVTTITTLLSQSISSYALEQALQTKTLIQNWQALVFPGTTLCFKGSIPPQQRAGLLQKSCAKGTVLSECHNSLGPQERQAI